MAIQRHRDHGVIADQRSQLDDADRLPARQYPSVRLVADGLTAIELLGVIEHGESGFIVPRRDPATLTARLAELAADPALRIRMGRAGRHRSETVLSAAPVTGSCRVLPAPWP